jgi:hypothetical protein
VRDAPLIEPFAAVRAPAVPEFLRAHSAVLVATLEDDPATRWAQALPPPSAELTPERCLGLLAAHASVGRGARSLSDLPHSAPASV